MRDECLAAVGEVQRVIPLVLVGNLTDGDAIVELVGIEEQPLSKLTLVGQAGRAPGRFAGAREGREQQGDQQGNDPYHDQEFHQRESVPGVACAQ